MEAFKVVSGVLQVGEGVMVGLTASQVAARSGSVAAVEGRRSVFRAATVLNFKAGEIIGLEDAEAAVGKAQMPKIEVAGDDDLRALEESEQAAIASAKKAKATAKEKAKTLSEQKSAVGAAREEGRKEGHAEGFAKGMAEGDKKGYERGFAEGRAAAEAESTEVEEKAWADVFASSDDLKAQFKSAEEYIAARRAGKAK